ncbi:MAG: precorrin-8X methylmutase [Anaerolineae bacterium]|nr:precorrin-8X methylmutase [Anaerolineae bacterium]
MLPQQIATESFRRIRAEIAEMGLTPDPAHAPFIERVIHSTADFEFAQRLQFSPHAIAAGVAALRRGCAIVTDVTMVRSGINETRVQALGGTLHCFVDANQISDLATQAGITRSAMGMRMAHEYGLINNGIVVVGNAPTALFEILRLITLGHAHPSLVVGVPVGFVNVIESKQALMQEKALATASCEWVATEGRKGGSTVAAAIINTLLRIAQNAAADEIAPI